jgi:hypothetical protein
VNGYRGNRNLIRKYLGIFRFGFEIHHHSNKNDREMNPTILSQDEKQEI